ncbi:MAG: hypothetical protein HXM94_01135 [Parvimonas micra]|uniref:Uncharacterized protein n=1 Tax=Parvimonas micra TaxID=33033 RepID=A0A930H232_9FIRM|nr:hypothetical protein [Parvimonas micra]MBF1306380.1 hypothetical protein [Parvimonas micra]
MLEELPQLPTIEGFEELVVGVSPVMNSESNNENELDAIKKLSKPKIKRKVLSERERQISGFHDTLLAASEKLSSAHKGDLNATVLLFNLSKSELFFREEPWDFISDFGINVYIGTSQLNATSVDNLVSMFVLDILFDNYQNRSKLSIFPELIEAKDVFLKILSLERREILFRSRFGLNYAQKISYKLHELCGSVLDAFINNGFFESVPDLLVEKQFEIPGWTDSRIIQIIDDGKNKTNVFDLVELSIRLGHLTSEIDGEISPLILSKIDELLLGWFKENQTEEFIMLLKGSGCKYPFIGTLLPKKHLKSFPRFIKEVERFGIGVLGENEII